MPITTHLSRKFRDDDSAYEVEVTDDGLTVYSECCADTMSAETAEAVLVALAAHLGRKIAPIEVGA